VTGRRPDILLWLAYGAALAAAVLVLREAPTARDARGAVLFVLLVESAAAAVVGPVAAAGESPAASSLAGRVLPPLPAAFLVAAALPARLLAARGDPSLMTLSLEGALLPLALALLGAGVARLARAASAAPAGAALAGTVAASAPGLSLFLVAPLLRLAPDPAALLPVLLRVSPVTLLGGSLLGIDVLRTGPLYDALPIAAYYPYAYPPFLLRGLTPGGVPPIALAGALFGAAAAALTRRAKLTPAPA